MDDEDDRRLLDIIGDVQAFNDYLQGSTSKLIGEDDVRNATNDSGTFFTSSTSGSNSGPKDGCSLLGEFSEGGVGLQLSSSLQFIEDELESGASPMEAELGDEDQPFDILQKSLLEADITDETMAQEAMLESQHSPAPSTTLSPFPSQLVSGGFGGITGTLSGGQPQAFLQQMPNGSTGHIQVLGSFNDGSPSMVTMNNLLRPGGTGTSGLGPVFSPSTTGHVTMPFKGCGTPIQNIIIQRGPTAQTLVRSIQPKPFPSGGQTVYNISTLGLQSGNTTITNTAPANQTSLYTTNGFPHSSQQVKVVNQTGGIVVHSPLGQHQGQQQSNLPQGQFLIPSTLSLTPGTSVHSFHSEPQSVDLSNAVTATTYSILTNQSAAVQLVAGQNFTTTTGSQLIVNHSQVGNATTNTWTGFAGGTPTTHAHIQTTSGQSHFTLVSTGQSYQGRQQVSVSPTQRFLVPIAQSTSTSPHTQEMLHAVSMDGLRQVQLVNLPGTKAVTQFPCMTHDSSPTTNAQVTLQKTSAPQQLTRGGMILQQLRRDHNCVLTGDKLPFTSVDDAIHRLLPYHVFQGASHTQEELSHVDNKFEEVAVQVLTRTQTMVNKYRRLLLVEAERSSPSSEMVMIDRTFNQEERSNLIQDKRMVLVDPDGFFEDFCCGAKLVVLNPIPEGHSTLHSVPVAKGTSFIHRRKHLGKYGGRAEATMNPTYRTDTQPGQGDLGGSGRHSKEEKLSAGEHFQTAVKKILGKKKGKRHHGKHRHNNNIIVRGLTRGNLTVTTATSHHTAAQLRLEGKRLEQPLPVPEHTHSPHPDTDSMLEAAVNSILEC